MSSSEEYISNMSETTEESIETILKSQKASSITLTTPKKASVTPPDPIAAIPTPRRSIRKIKPKKQIWQAISISSESDVEAEGRKMKQEDDTEYVEKPDSNENSNDS